MRHRLIIVDGQSTVGKSTISKKVYKQIKKSEKAYWLHEECEKHPIRDQEFEKGDIHTLDGMELNHQDMLQKWKQFSNDIKKSGQVCITEGCFLHAVDRYLLESSWSEEDIHDYFKEVVEIIKELNPLIVFLHRPDMKLSFEKAFKARGDWWKDLILKEPEGTGYFKTHEYTGDDSIFASLAYEQHQMDKIFETLSCDKLKVDTSDECWEEYVCQITEKAGYVYQNTEKTIPDVDKYCGTYKIQGGEGKWKINYDPEKKEVYTSLFWPYMPMKYLGDDEFELISFPIILKFKVVEEKAHFEVKGNYDWELNNKIFEKI